MEHFITSIHINEVRHLKNIEIKLNAEKRQHLILTGKNGSGKTSVLRAMKSYLQAINDRKLDSLKGEYLSWYNSDAKKLENATTETEKYKALEELKKDLRFIQKYDKGLTVSFLNENDIEILYAQGNFITAYFAADRESLIQRVSGVQDVKLDANYRIEDEPARILLKYMVHLKTQQSYARNEHDESIAKKIDSWFARFENALRILLDDNSIRLTYDYKNYNFLIEQKGRNPYSLDELSDGYSAIISIVADLILRMDRNWLLKGKLSQYDVEGVVLIDELETHLHVELQRKILPFLTEFFPKIQFIITTHSAYILNSISNACIYDLEKQVRFADFSSYSADEIAEGYFDVQNYSTTMQDKILRYQHLVKQEELSDSEKAERAQLRIELKTANKLLEEDISDEFNRIEEKKDSNG
jgi:predicted ATP-binding protein involved in virulence